MRSATGALSAEWVAVLAVCGLLVAGLLAAAPAWASTLRADVTRIVCQVVGQDCPAAPGPAPSASAPTLTGRAFDAKGTRSPVDDLGFGDPAACADVDGRDAEVCRGRTDGRLREDVADTVLENADFVPIEAVEGVECGRDPNEDRLLCGFRTRNGTGIIAGCQLEGRADDRGDRDCTDTGQDGHASITGNAIVACRNRTITAGANQPTTRFTTYAIVAGACLSTTGEVYGECHTQATTSNDADGSGNAPGHVADQGLTCDNRSLLEGQFSGCTPTGDPHLDRCVLSGPGPRVEVRCLNLSGDHHHCAVRSAPQARVVDGRVACTLPAPAARRRLNWLPTPEDVTGLAGCSILDISKLLGGPDKWDAAAREASIAALSNPVVGHAMDSAPQPPAQALIDGIHEQWNQTAELIGVQWAPVPLIQFHPLPGAAAVFVPGDVHDEVNEEDDEIEEVHAPGLLLLDPLAELDGVNHVIAGALLQHLPHFPLAAPAVQAAVQQFLQVMALPDDQPPLPMPPLLDALIAAVAPEDAELDGEPDDLAGALIFALFNGPGAPPLTTHALVVNAGEWAFTNAMQSGATPAQADAVRDEVRTRGGLRPTRKRGRPPGE